MNRGRPRILLGDACKVCGLSIINENAYKHPGESGRLSCRNCRRVAWTAARRNPPMPKPMIEPREAWVDHTKCDPQEPESLCDECSAILTEVKAKRRRVA